MGSTAIVGVVFVFALIFVTAIFLMALLCCWGGTLWWVDSRGRDTIQSLNRTTLFTGAIGSKQAGVMPVGIDAFAREAPATAAARASSGDSAAFRAADSRRSAGPRGSSGSSGTGADWARDERSQARRPVAEAHGYEEKQQRRATPTVTVVSPEVVTASPGVERRQHGASNGPAAAAPAEEVQLQHGFASKIACHFGGTLKSHSDNVSAVVDVFHLTVIDLCYCFLCLEEVAAAEDGADLTIMSHGVGPYAARIWVVTLARFVRGAQSDTAALDDDRVSPLSMEWQYKQPHFVSILHTAEAKFQRKHGLKLLQAFRQTSVRNAEVSRARETLLSLYATAHPQRILSEPTMAPMPAALPAPELLQALPPCTSSADSDMLLAAIENLRPADGKRTAANSVDASEAAGPRKRPRARPALENEARPKQKPRGRQ